MRINQRERLAAESTEEREARLQRMRINESERLAAESVEEREGEREVRANREQPFKQYSVQMKMRRFHEYFATLNSPKCLTCSESFPGIQLHSPTTECIRCYRDKHVIGASLSEPHINGSSMFAIYIYVWWYVRHAKYMPKDGSMDISAK